MILLDIGLPGMSGYDVAKILRQEGMTGSLLIAVSGDSQQKDRERSLEAGFDHHLGKPVDLDALLDLIREHERRSVG